MYLTQTMVQAYENDGFLILPDCLRPNEIAALKAELPAIFVEDSPRRVLEKQSGVVRSVYGSHQTNALYQQLARLPRLVGPAIQLLGSDVYVYQFKINAKAAFAGDIWEWHQDYVFWQKEDGMSEPRVINVVVFLDDVNEFNGPILFIPGTHRQGVIDIAAREQVHTTYAHSPAWISNLTADLKYALTKETIARLVEKHGIVAPKAPAGSVLLFHANVVHGSAPNMSPFDRKLVLVTYNSVENRLHPVERPRPEFLVSRDYTPVVPLEAESLLEVHEFGDEVLR